MPAPDDHSYDLIDSRPIAREAPYTFFLPSPDELAAVKAGDLVKLGFAYRHDIERWGAERMWVAVEQADARTLAGRLETQPDEPTSTLRPGDGIRFERHHIFAVEWAEPAAVPLLAPVRQFWDRCFVDACVLDGAEPVGFLYREEPDPCEEDDRDPDSGWRVRARTDGVTEAALAEREVRYVAIGAVLNRDDSWLHLIDAPVGSAFVRDFATGTYLASEA